MSNLENFEDLKKDRDFLQEKLNSPEESFRHHLKLMKQLEAWGFVPNPVQKIIVDGQLPKENSGNAQDSYYNQTLQNTF